MSTISNETHSRQKGELVNALRELGPQNDAFGFYETLRGRGLSNDEIRSAMRELIDQQIIEITSDRRIQIRS